MITKEILERVLEMVPIASDDATRYTIMGVYIVSNNGTVTLTATNGHMLITREMSGQCPNGKYMLFRDEVPALKLVLKECKSDEEIAADIDSSGGLIIGKQTKGRISKMGLEYPDYKRVIPTLAEEVAITFNADYLIALAKVLREGEKRGCSEVRLVFNPSNPKGAILVERADKNITGVLMPIGDRKSESIAADYVLRKSKGAA